MKARDRPAPSEGIAHDSSPISDARAVMKLVGHVIRGGKWGDVYGCTSRDYEALYALGHQLYGQGRYQDAQQVFNLLVSYNHIDRRFYMGLAASLQMLGKMEEALTYYCLASILNIDDPVPTFHSCECLVALRRVEEALNGLETVIEQCVGPNYSTLRARGEGMKGLLIQALRMQQGVENDK